MSDPQSICSAPSCDRPAHGRGLCSIHYKEWWSEHRSENVRPSMADRFWAKVDKNGPIVNPHLGPCWLWTGAVNKSGYGSFKVHTDRRARRHRWANAHTVAYELMIGPVPDVGHRTVLDHLCRNRQCVNPDHLEPVTNRENILRGEAPVAKRAQATHCVNGHEFSTENTRIRANGTRSCKECQRERNRTKFDADYWRNYRAKRTAQGRPVGSCK